jgi:hypothetical protein
MSLRRLEGPLCAPHDVPGEVVKVCEADPVDDYNGNMLCAWATPRRPCAPGSSRPGARREE